MNIGVFFSPRMGQLQECHSVIGWGNFILSLNPRIGQLQECHPVLGWANLGVSFSPRVR